MYEIRAVWAGTNGQFLFTKALIFNIFTKKLKTSAAGSSGKGNFAGPDSYMQRQSV
jgi:hypothetical protein